MCVADETFAVIDRLSLLARVRKVVLIMSGAVTESNRILPDRESSMWIANIVVWCRYAAFDLKTWILRICQCDTTCPKDIQVSRFI